MKNNIPVSVSVSIPDELIFGILTGLPVESLLRFRRVCKRWRSMISDPSFTEAHRSRSAAAAALLFSVPDLCSLRSKSTLVSIKAGEARIPIVPVFSHLTISHSVNGLVCIYEHYAECYRKPPLSLFFPEPSLSPSLIVYNLSTREHVTLPPSIYARAGLYSHCNTLGFDPSTNTYKILRVWLTDQACKYEIFSLGSGAWRIIEDGPVYGLTTKGICLNGTIYWAKNRPVGGEMRQNVMIAFDVGEEKFRDVPVPPEAPLWNGMTWNMIEIDGHIAIVDFRDVVERVSNVMTLWKLEDSINGVWREKIIVLPEFVMSSNWLPHTMRRPSRPFVTSIHSGEITLIPSWFFIDWYVFHYNLEEERARMEVISRSPENDWNDSFPCIDHCDISVYKESLTSLTEICRL